MGKIKETELQQRWILQSYFTPARAPGHHHGKATAPTDTISSAQEHCKATWELLTPLGRHDTCVKNTKHFAFLNAKFLVEQKCHDAQGVCGATPTPHSASHHHAGIKLAEHYS